MEPELQLLTPGQPNLRLHVGPARLINRLQHHRLPSNWDGETNRWKWLTLEAEATLPQPLVTPFHGKTRCRQRREGPKGRLSGQMFAARPPKRTRDPSDDQQHTRPRKETQSPQPFPLRQYEERVAAALQLYKAARQQKEATCKWIRKCGDGSITSKIQQGDHLSGQHYHGHDL